MAESRRSPESLAREAMKLYWQVQSHGLDAAVPEGRQNDSEFGLVAIAQEVFERLSKRKQAEVLRRMRELEELPSEGRCTTFHSGVARPDGVPESMWLMYLTVATNEEHLRLRVVAPIPWLLIKAVCSDGLGIHPDWEELSPWSLREFGERMLGYRASAQDWAERHTASMLLAAYRRLGRELFRDWR